MIAGGHVIVVGSANVDLSVTVGRLPRPGETVLGGELVRDAGGKGANQAVAVRRSGAEVYFIGAVGKDDLGEELVRALRSDGVDVSLVARSEAATGTALIFVDPDGENVIVVSPGANATVGESAVAGLRTLLPSAAALLLQLEVPVSTALAAARAARETDVPVVLNAAPLPPSPDPDLDALLALVDLLVVNEAEAAGFTALPDPSPATTNPATTAAAVLLAKVPGDVVITLGERGAIAAQAPPLGTPAGTPFGDRGAIAATGAATPAGMPSATAAPPAMMSVQAFPVVAVDAVGAGDAFCGELVVARYRHGLPLAAAVRRACAAGALGASRRGVRSALPTRAEIDALLAQHSSPETA